MTRSATNDPDLGGRLGDLYAERSERFDALARAARLDPARDFRARDLRALRFADADLRGFDFSDSDLRGAGVRLAGHLDASTRLDGALVDADDASWLGERGLEPDDDRDDLARDLRRAMDRRQFEFVFQPKIGLRTRAAVGVEALLRWRHPERGLISPAVFVPLLEELDLIETVTYWTIEAAIERQRTLRHRGFDLIVALNISPMMLGKRDLIVNCRHLVGSDRPGLRFEVSESALIAEYDTVREHVRDLEALGISVAIDDYGTGFSSLTLLKESGAKELKIDASFVRPLEQDQSEPLIVRSTIDMGHALGMEVTAEGVETSAQLRLLAVMGCDAAQGFAISRPLAFEALIAWLKDATLPVALPAEHG